MAGGNVTIDHLLWAATDLDEASEALRAATGLHAAPGGRHPGWGTHNALVGLGDTYVEVLAVDPAQDGGWLADEVRTLPGPRLFRWALRTDDLDTVVARIRTAGLTTAPTAMSRTTPAGDSLRWRIAFLGGHDLGPIVPFIIDWLDTPHPTTTMPSQGALLDVELAHPAHDDLQAVLTVLGLEVPVHTAASPSLWAHVTCPHGTVVLGS